MCHLCIAGILEGEERDKGIEKVFEEIVAKNVPNLKKETYDDSGNTESSKWDEPKQTYTRTCYKKNGKKN